MREFLIGLEAYVYTIGFPWYLLSFLIAMTSIGDRGDFEAADMLFDYPDH